MKLVITMVILITVHIEQQQNTRKTVDSASYLNRNDYVVAKMHDYKCKNGNKNVHVYVSTPFQTSTERFQCLSMALLKYDFGLNYYVKNVS